MGLRSVHNPRANPTVLGRVDRHEWVGGRIRVVYLAGQARVRRDLVVWCAAGTVVGAGLIEPEAPDSAAVRTLIATFREPASGGPRRPGRLRVASPSLAAALRSRLGERVDVVLAPTPELDALLSEVRRSLGLDEHG
jgi:hypothetical protein